MHRRTTTALALVVLLTVSLVAASGATLGAGVVGASDGQQRADAGGSHSVADEGPVGPYVSERWSHDGGEPDIASVVSNGAVSTAATPNADYRQQNGTGEDWSQLRSGADRDGAIADAGPTGPSVETRWSHRGAEAGVSPVVVNGTVYAGYTTYYEYNRKEGAVKAINEESGLVQWHRTDLGSIESVATDGERIFVATTTVNNTGLGSRDESHLLALNATTGETVWSQGTGGSLEVTNGTVYTHSSAFDAATGATVWSDTNVSVDAAANGTLYGTTGDGLTAWDATDRSVEWQWTTDGEVHGFAVDDGSVYATLDNNQTVALDATDGAVRWERTVDAPFQNSTSEWISAPAVSDGRVYVTTDDDMLEQGRDESVSAVHALDASDGSVAWRFQTLATLRSAPAVGNNSVYVGGRYFAEQGGSERTIAYGLNATTGAERWGYATRFDVQSHDLFIPGYVRATVDDGFVFLGAGSERAPPFDSSLDRLQAIAASDTELNASERLANDTPRAIPENQPPNVTVSTDPANATDEGVPLGSNVTLTASASDSDGEVRSVEWRVDDGEWTSGNATSFRVTVCEPHRVTVKVRDNEGAETTRNVTVNVTDCAPQTNGTGEDWSQLRSGADRDGAIADAGPTGPSVETRWRHRGAEAGVSPVTANGTVYAGYTTYYEYNRKEGAVKAINEESGLLRWHRTDLGSVESVATDGERIFVTTTTVNRTGLAPRDESHLRTLNATTGETVWSRNTGGSLEVTNGTVYTHSSAFDAATGATVWSDTNVTVHAVANGTLYGATGDGLTAWNATDRSVAWNWTTDAEVRGFAIADGSVYATLDNNQTVALDTADGSVRWNRTVDAPFQNSTSEWISAPAVADDTVYVTTDDEMEEQGRDERVSAVHALDTDDGSVAWRFETLATLRSAPAVSNASVYVGGRYFSEQGDGERTIAYGLNATTGAERWGYATDFDVQGHDLFLPGYVRATVDDGLVFLGAGSERAPPFDGSLDRLQAIAASETAMNASERLANDTPRAIPENQPPTVAIETDPANATEEKLPTGTNVTLTANATDSDGEITGYEWWVNGEPIEDAGESITVAVDPCVDIEVRVRVTDDGGDVDSAEVTILDGE